ncbi:MAG: hypothetical protein A2418_01110 [Candidatus Brennerbacteria bacterium RIFOXYC1_FULL_41_11]|uniref:DUF11 domain-containing protein n=1 Tax=Candidatus Brennerbacteria bacterium RIFOXYD1_FULL_41_16 TaxID=1797529 RepID=A0A1G1XM32_9BACT|nr:MAG: hypothetical protein A2391_02980 [Candidatus Brennerbacteria bacterium RIFOXYB1_FULL_41_13]OGY40042.1 MAG: hypothetical protein A2418_01110 [Candidatus Brennerbacteria bacterium RIFOXYC1_FULL_41_11]OGY40974.1 MAG: hypothetical protein A2570_00580 [Candidatus Brennerbacteria bacterium RIFOXYD1_FULL_41_16]
MTDQPFDNLESPELTSDNVLPKEDIFSQNPEIRQETEASSQVKINISKKPRTEWLEEAPIHETSRPVPQILKLNFDLKKVALIAGGVIFLGGIVLGFFSYLANMAPPDNLGLDILAANTVNVGEKVLFEVIIANRSGSQIIEDLSLTIRADDGTVFSDLPGSALMQKAIGDLESQAEFKELIPVIFWGKNHEQRKVEVTARYNFAGQQNSFEKVIEWNPVIVNSGAQMAISLPQEVLSGEIFSGYFTYRNVTGKKLSQSRLILESLKGLSFSFIEPQHSSRDSVGNYVWQNTDLEPQKEQRVNFKAIISGNDDSGQILKAIFKVPVRGKDIVISETDEDLVVVANPLALDVTINDSRVYSVTPGENLQYKINFKNNYSVPLKDVVISADFSDPWVDQSSIRLDTGFYSSKTKKITWNGGNTPAILSLDSGETGEVMVYLGVKKIYPKGAINNQMNVKIEISAANKPGSIGTQVLTKTESVSKINGRLVLIPKVLFKDNPQTGFTNLGMAQPKVNKVTQYSFYLDLEAQANDFKNVFITTTFPANVSYDGKIKGDTETTEFIFNQRTGQLTWRVDYLPAWQKKSIVFQIGALPSMDQLGHLMQIVEDINVTGDDVFTFNKFKEVVRGIFSDLPHDNIVDQGTGRVGQ